MAAPRPLLLLQPKQGAVASRYKPRGCILTLCCLDAAQGHQLNSPALAHHDTLPVPVFPMLVSSWEFLFSRNTHAALIHDRMQELQLQNKRHKNVEKSLIYLLAVTKQKKKLH